MLHAFLPASALHRDLPVPVTCRNASLPADGDLHAALRETRDAIKTHQSTEERGDSNCALQNILYRDRPVVSA